MDNGRPSQLLAMRQQLQQRLQQERDTALRAFHDHQQQTLLQQHQKQLQQSTGQAGGKVRSLFADRKNGMPPAQTQQQQQLHAYQQQQQLYQQQKQQSQASARSAALPPLGNERGSREASATSLLSANSAKMARFSQDKMAVGAELASPPLAKGRGAQGPVGTRPAPPRNGGKAAAAAAPAPAQQRRVVVRKDDYDDEGEEDAYNQHRQQQSRTHSDATGEENVEPAKLLFGIKNRVEQMRRRSGGSSRPTPQASKGSRPVPQSPADAYHEHETAKELEEQEQAEEERRQAEEERRQKAEEARKRKKEADERKRREEERRAKAKEREQLREQERQRRKEEEERRQQEEEYGGGSSAGANGYSYPEDDIPIKPAPPPARVAKPAAQRPAKVRPAPVQRQPSAEERRDSEPAFQPAKSNEIFQEILAKAVEEDDGGQGGVRLVPCGICNRKFAADRLAKHTQACEIASKKRKAFDGQKQRVEGTEAAKYIRDAEKRDQQYEKKLQSKKGVWKAKHEALVAAMRANRGGAGGGAGAAPASIPDERVECPGCKRKMNEDVAERHMPKCVERNSRMPPKRR